MLSWDDLRDQFGPECGQFANFKKKLRGALHQVNVVYPDARIEEVNSRGVGRIAAQIFGMLNPMRARSS